ncbi:hypothetical protein ACN47E_010091 [Coniothyrium glycines]
MDKLKEAENIATQRLRKTFKYPTESDDEDTIEAGMDAQDRANLVSTLSTHDTSSTTLYTQLLLILPLAPIPFYFPRLFALSTLLPSLVAIASLLASAYTLYFLPLPPQDMEPLPGAQGGSSHMTSKSTATGKANAVGGGRGGGGYGHQVPPWEKTPEKPGRRPVPYVAPSTADLLAEHLVTVNRAVCGVLALLELWRGTAYSEALMVGGGFLPGVICLVILYARTELRIISMDELERLQGGVGRGVERGR